ncbi:MAG: N-acetylmuramic acid 6-phosphate etherase [Saprospiraceae bacterium]|nr:N-acetylmuramic acid 6-phosphate etherase [Saprospiraceae bacterium]
MDPRDKVTEQDSLYRNLEQMETAELLYNINREDQTVAQAVHQVIPAMTPLINVIAEKMKEGGRLFYIGAGTSGRLGILDASECPPTFGVPEGWVVGVMAGGDTAIRKAVENAEDSKDQAWLDLQEYMINKGDVVIGIAASGTTPYVVEGLRACRQKNITTACITCNYHTPLSEVSDYPLEIIVGPEFVTGSTRMKAGTAQKLALNMISTCVMIKLGRVRDNKMVDMQISNAKLRDRAAKMIQNNLDIPYEKALELLDEFGSVRRAIEQGATSRT